jgi:hypothetical protein
MDRFVASLSSEPDGDLTLCLADGIAYQTDMTARVEYDDAYFDKCAGYEGAPIADAINAARIGLVARHYAGRLCDVGIGSGEFITKRGAGTYGFDVNPRAVEWLKARALYVGLRGFAAYTFWDVLEHVETPAEYLDEVSLHGFMFLSLPVFADMRLIRASRHYRPGEHLYYFTNSGIIAFMNAHGFMLLESNDDETQAGRDSIRSYAFKRWRTQ